MKHPIRLTVYLLVFGLATIVCSCQSIEQRRDHNDPDSMDLLTEKHDGTILTDVPFAIAQNYFVLNDAKTPEDPKITTQEAFDHVFGNATLMGEQGKPTPIDFNQQFVIAIVLDQSDFATTIEPMDLRQQHTGELKFRYAVVVGERQQYISQPALILVVNKKYEASVVLDRVD
ncbi:hypothetical protein M8998_00935 [Sphingobacterium sp. lm-10]|uniref:hypothetical protein n=1 Tax=Sphingobacterium sp. lm-10 TaxID=2944904 RepID=UPI0020225688|nr:hypothetical protein [Sphingobacterium sp. lm-10]MCL7986494.1 hypothetical protein [Sphingobacterium sp. lm-10]